MNLLKRRNIDMTQGSISRNLILFALPIAIGELFAQLYSMVDSFVVGRYVGTAAFSGVGTLQPIIGVLTGSVGGLATGISVVLSQYYGAKNRRKTQSAVHTAVSISIVLALIIITLGQLLTPSLLHLIRVPDEVYHYSETYLRIYLLGVIFTASDAALAAALRASGDSHTQVRSAMAAGVLNTVLDLLFVVVFRWDVSGVAWATVASQAFNMAYKLTVLLRTKTMVRFFFAKLRIDRDELRKMLIFALPVILQQTVVSLSNIFVQRYINWFDTDCMAGWAAYMKAHLIINIPLDSFGAAIAVLVGQCLGRGDIPRLKRGYATGTALSFIVTAVLALGFSLFAPQFIGLFAPEEAAIRHGAQFIRTLAATHLFYSVANTSYSALRAGGNTRAPMRITLGCYVALRQLYLFLVSDVIPGAHTTVAVAMSYPVGWSVAAVIAVVLLRRMDWGKYRLVKDEEVRN